MAEPSRPTISVQTKYIPASDPSLPALALRTTVLVDSYMLWIGTTEGSPEDAQTAPLQGTLARDWACAMPAPNGSPSLGPATSLFRSSSSDIALSMAQRLARRFGKQIFLSVDIPSSFLSMGQGRLLLDAEKGIVETLKAVESIS
ncbi:hypothetical protein SERLADRAFT_465133 [Serpula lacrymans var. lacrymans S7.9]|uniref:Proteasome assembly chaperone 3 n=1 Tax=Serpula lacrymans var. lacrymans (strain S7.9) TaxID=578457 RepID=F8NUU1_SERL9|nr:uncharacterized protein SERLADRAFT_465133 [Serpula lacrymans var. lacrymans S7.9]EGO25257.1 hypothetical protein SERLADRAFT_465133 [Serpula lacrymans var. lacrymans S7.9]